MKKTPEEKLMYAQFREDFQFCFACGISNKARTYNLKPDFPRWLEVPHILGGTGQRTHDRRNIVRLCKLCHTRAHSLTIKLTPKEGVPNLIRANLLFIKRQHDPDWYDIDYLNDIAIQKMPEPEEPDSWFLMEYAKYQPRRWREMRTRRTNEM